jgi:TRAP-type transport system periplasmic protein
MARILLWSVAVFFVAASAYVLFADGREGEERPKEVRWLLSHKPTDVFTRAAEVFKDTLEKESGGALTLSVLEPEDIGITGPGDISHERVREALSRGEADIASVYTVALGKTIPDIAALSLPFLFASYDEAQAALDGAALDALPQTGELRGLAFTMSGGFRVLASRDMRAERMEDFAGKRIATSGGDIAEATIAAFGAIPVPLDLEAGPVDTSSVDAVETTYARLSAVLPSGSEYTRSVIETNHSVFLTAIVAHGPFFDSLSDGERSALLTASRAAARVEREDSIALNASVKADLTERGSAVQELSAETRKEMIEAAQSVYEAFKDAFSPETLRALGAEN